MGYLDLVGSFVYREPLFRSKLDALAENDAQLKTDGWAQNTKGLFYQASVPTGWTQDTSQNDKAIRVVGSTGGGVAGGTQALSATISLAHSHSLPTPTQGSHTHAYSNHTHIAGSVANVRQSTEVIADDGGGFMYLFQENVGSGSITELTATLGSPGALTLSTQADHNHGAVGSSLTDMIFAYCDVIIGTKNAPSGSYTDLTSYWHTGDKVDFDPFASYANNDAYNLGNLMPSGTLMVFGQASAPAGWTKNISLNDRMLRVVSGAGGGNGGSTLISSGVSLAHSHSLSTIVDHAHTYPSHLHSLTNGPTSSTVIAANASFGYIQDSLGGGGLLAVCQQVIGLPTSSVTVYKTHTTTSGGGSTGAAGGHTHALVSNLADFTLAYVDVIKCSKDSTGAPNAYVDMTAVFAWKKLVSYQRLNNLAKSDSYIEFHTTPTTTQTFFYMASPPTGWTKITSQHDKALRMVDGSTGGTPGGGAQLLSTTIPLAHTHTIPAQADHTHSIAHTHDLDTGTKTIVAPGQILIQGGGRICASNTGAGASAPGVVMNKTSAAPVETPAVAGGHDHGTVTDSQLTNVVLAYADVIWCAKS